MDRYKNSGRVAESSTLAIRVERSKPKFPKVTRGENSTADRKVIERPLGE